MKRTGALPKLFASRSVFSKETDEDLMLRCQQGEEAAFATLFERHASGVRAYCRALLRDHAVADELAQETFLRAYRSRSSFRNEHRFAAWLYSIARHAAYDHGRHHKERAAEPDEIERRSGADENDALGHLLARAERHAVRDCIERLPENYREAMVLRVHAEMAYDEMSEVLGASLARVKNWIHRAKTQLATCLEGKGYGTR